MPITPRSPRTALLLGCLAAALLAALAYLNALDNPFIYDDFRTVVDNGSITSLADLRTIVLHEVTRPLTNLSLAVDRALWGPAPFGYHLGNLLLHVGNVVFVFLLALRLSADAGGMRQLRAGTDGSGIVALVAAMLFAVHPVMSETVGYISSRPDLLCLTFVLGAFFSARRWLQRGGTVWYVLAWLLWVAGLLSKETAAVLPLLVLAYARTVGRDTIARPARATWQLHVPFVGVMLLAGVARLVVFARMESGPAASALTPASVGAMAMAGWHYVLLVASAGGQTIFHAPPVVAGPSDARAWLAVLAWAAVAAAAWRLRHRTPLAVFGVTWFGLLLAPALLLGGLDGGVLVAEHRVYMPVVGAFLCAGWLAEAAMPLFRRFRSTRVLAPLAFAVVVLMLGGRTWLRNLVWENPVDVWSEAVQYAPGHWLPRTVLAESLHAAGQHEAAVEAYRQALVLRPDNQGASVNLAVCLSEMGRRAEAGRVVDDLEAMVPESSFVQVGRGAVAVLEGRGEEARRFFLRAIARDPSNVLARQWLSVMAEASADREEALHRCYELQRLTPGRLSIDECIARSLAR